ncbi:MAG: hypothetical protein AB1750_08980 [Chloroflexota bacterium]
MPTRNSRDPKVDENTARFRAILSSNEEEEPPKQTPPSRSVLDRLPGLPKRKESASKPPPRASASRRDRPPEVVEGIVVPSSAASGEREPAGPSGKRRFGPAFWTVTGILSLVVNAALIAIVVILLGIVSSLNLKMNAVLAYAKLPEETVRGLYDNFVKMDNAHIRTNIAVTTEIPVQFNLDLNTQTVVTLSQDTQITQARVTLNTGGLNITNAPANIILPAGTQLPITLVLTVPVDKRVPVSLVVPVDIALNQTELHDPFVGLRLVVEPLYCLFDPNLVSPDGALTCEQETP